MKIFDVKQKLILKTNRDISQTDIAYSLGVTRQTINKRLKTNSELTETELKKIEKYFNVNLTNVKKEDQEPTPEQKEEAHQTVIEWQAQLNLTEQELFLLIDKLKSDKLMFVLLAQALDGDSTALERLKKLLC